MWGFIKEYRSAAPNTHWGTKPPPWLHGVAEPPLGAQGGVYGFLFFSYYYYFLKKYIFFSLKKKLIK
jgi:hypothetical protein